MTAEFDELNDESENATIERAEKLLAGMSTGAPAINLMASCLLEDEHGITRAPLLLSVLGFKLSDVTPKETSRNRRFRIDLEYGIDKHRMKWSIERNATDLAYLAYKLERTRIVSRVVGNKSQPLPRLQFHQFENWITKEKRLKVFYLICVQETTACQYQILTITTRFHQYHQLCLE